MKRRLLNAITVVSMLLCVATLLVWVRAQFAMDWLRWYATSDAANTWRAWDVFSNRFTICFSRKLYLFEHPGNAVEFRDGALNRPDGIHLVSNPPYSRPLGESIWNQLGFAVAIEPLHYDLYSTDRYQLGMSYYDVPYWFFVLVFLGVAAPGMISFRRHRREARLARSNCCLTCGYDLRATPDRCPECGAMRNPPQLLINPCIPADKATVARP